MDVYAGETYTIMPAITQDPGGVGATVDSVFFYVDNGAEFGLCAYTNSSCAIGNQTYIDTDTSKAFQAKLTTGTTVGATATLALDGGMTTGQTCANDYIGLRIINSPSWTQAKDGDIVAVGSISSTIPSTCVAPNCTPALITSTTTGSPGVAVAGTTVSDGSGVSVPPTSPNLTVEGATYGGTLFDYTYFAKKASIVTFNNISTSVDQTSLLSGSTYAGYHWKKVTGNATISGNTDLTTNRVILFVDGNLAINGPIKLTDGRGFFMAVVNGNITVAASVGGPQETPTPLPDLEGVYFAGGSFITGTAGVSSDVQLHVRGAVAAGNFTLQRDLINNSKTPAELFEYGADQVMQLPAFLSRKQVIWREVAP